mgnify:CR=1 FL=1
MAEKLCLGDISTGASNDIQRASAIARKMVASYGMSERLGTVAFDSGHDEVFIGRTMTQGRSYSESVAAQIDEEVKALVGRAYQRCEAILTERREQLDAVAAYLLDHETMGRDCVFGRGGARGGRLILWGRQMPSPRRFYLEIRGAPISPAAAGLSQRPSQCLLTGCRMAAAISLFSKITKIPVRRTETASRWKLLPQRHLSISRGQILGNF